MHPELPAVDLPALVGPYAVDPWVVSERLANAPSLAMRAIAVGNVGRYALALAVDAQAALATRLGGDAGPPPRARAWAAGLDEVQRRALVGLARAAAVGAAEALDELSSDPSGVMVEAVRRSRDELESLRFILEAAGAGADIEEAVACLDEQAQPLVDLFDAERSASAHCAAMAQLCPLPWWA